MEQSSAVFSFTPKEFRRLMMAIIYKLSDYTPKACPKLSAIVSSCDKEVSKSKVYQAAVIIDAARDKIERMRQRRMKRYARKTAELREMEDVEEEHIKSIFRRAKKIQHLRRAYTKVRRIFCKRTDPGRIKKYNEKLAVKLKNLKKQ